MKWKLVRRCVQVAVILLILSPALGFGIFSGTLISGELFGVELTDVLAALDYTLAAKTLTAGMLIGAAVVLVFYFFVGGRVFCGWVCPVHLFSEMARTFNKRFGFVSLRPPRWQKYAVLAVVLVLSFVASVPVFEMVSPIGAVTRAMATGLRIDRGDGSTVVADVAGGVGESDLTVTLVLNGTLVLLMFILLMDAFVKKAWWCEYTCPVGALYSIVGRKSPVGVRIDHDACTDCGDCFGVCPVPHVLTPAVKGEVGWVQKGDCSNCLNCVDACDEKALALRFWSRARRL
ncbi:MAG: 4Fe-4S binding protein [Candidatus Latescibacterota bacterium]|nr:MAG: 4Fe-4S binding protein [Candidatus Latescibacterota bacterium]